ncbi:MAG: hypothetical protein OQJ97_18690 [Rhodospirillales bacterium]|nr:hypothetical protein [Rhodospirillales bacterium]
MALLLSLICCLFIISQIPGVAIGRFTGEQTFSKTPLTFVTGAGLFMVIGFFSFIKNLGKLANAHKRRVENEDVLREANLHQ